MLNNNMALGIVLLIFLPVLLALVGGYWLVALVLFVLLFMFVWRYGNFSKRNTWR
jgi:heme O synthase-like polyprenyltransferase